MSCRKIAQSSNQEAMSSFLVERTADLVEKEKSQGGKVKEAFAVDEL